MLRKRDQNVELQWPHLSFMLERIARMDRNETRFKKLLGNMFNYYRGVVWEVQPGHKRPVQHNGKRPGEKRRR